MYLNHLLCQKDCGTLLFRLNSDDNFPSETTLLLCRSMNLLIFAINSAITLLL
jgi:hypothetical protein